MPSRTPIVVLTTSEAAPRLHPNLSPRTMERWRRSGRGPKFVQIGRRVGYTPEALDAWRAAQERKHALPRPKRRGGR